MNKKEVSINLEGVSLEYPVYNSSALSLGLFPQEVKNKEKETKTISNFLIIYFYLIN